MVGQPDNYQSVLKAISEWSPEHRAILAKALLNEAAADKIRQKPRVDELIGLLKTNALPPTDEDVKQWIDEHRMRKYG